MRFSKSIFILVSLFFLSFTVHKYYVSVTEIKFAEQKQELQISMRFFIDDIELALNQRFNKEFELSTVKEPLDTDKFLELYIAQKFQIKINGKTISTRYLGKEYENDVVYFYLIAEKINAVDVIEVTNSILFEQYEDQENYIQLNINDKRNTFILTKRNDKEMLKY
ncbi:DUF6702 family protein [Namhaeicola litoreus]|uniref:DUF6702 family protein n=1 Tax=Namhaeicola litoreus TaxID=1052145 RepID=A0ABW3Y756_9FLAO